MYGLIPCPVSGPGCLLIFPVNLPVAMSYKSLFTSLVSVFVSAGALLHGATVAEWNFDQDLSLVGASLADASGVDITGNGNTMLGYDQFYGATYSALGDTPNGTGLSMEANGNNDGYVANANAGALRYWSPSNWTVEATVSLDGLSGWRTLIGKDGSTSGSNESDFYLQACGDTGEFRVLFKTVSGQRVDLRSGVVPDLGRWYQLAVVSDGATVSLYVNDGAGYALAGSVALTGATADDNRLSDGNGSAWIFMRGWYQGKSVDRVDGRMDNIRFSDVALSPAEFLSTGSKGTLILISSRMVLPGHGAAVLDANQAQRS